jgi:hypothetical protein
LRAVEGAMVKLTQNHRGKEEGFSRLERFAHRSNPAEVPDHDVGVDRCTATRGSLIRLPST